VKKCGVQPAEWRIDRVQRRQRPHVQSTRPWRAATVRVDLRAPITSVNGGGGSSIDDTVAWVVTVGTHSVLPSLVRRRGRIETTDALGVHHLHVRGATTKTTMVMTTSLIGSQTGKVLMGTLGGTTYNGGQPGCTHLKF